MTTAWDERGNPIATRDVQAWDEQGRPIQAPAVSETEQRSPGYRRAYARERRVARPQGVVDQMMARTGLGDEVSGAAGYVAQGAQNLIRRVTGQPIDVTAGAAGQAALDYERQQRDQFAREHPGQDVLANVGALAATLGRAAPAASGMLGRLETSANPWVRYPTRMGVGAATGGVLGAGFGFANTDGDLDTRGQGATQAGGIGAALGAAAPPVLAAALPAISGLGRFASRITVDPNAAGMAGGNIRLRQPPARPPRLPRNSAIAVERLANRARMSPDDVGAAMAEAARSPQGQVLADVFGEPGRQTVRSMTQFPGQTGSRAQDVVRTRFAEAPGRINQALSRGLKVGESRLQAMQRLEQEYRTVGANQYRPIFERPLTAEQRSGLEARLAPYADDPIFNSARNQAEAIFRRDRANGLVGGDIEDNFARWAHYLKMGLDDASKLAGNPMQSGGIGPTQLRGIRDMRARVIQAIDDSLPGYREARAQWAGLKEAEDALQTGADWLRMLPEEVVASRTAMSPFELHHARIGLADEINQALGGRIVGQRNVANALDNASTQKAIAAVFDTPQEAADFLDTVNTQNQLMRNSATWLGGSSSAANLAYGADNGGAALAAVGEAAKGNVGGAVGRLLNGAGDALSMGLVERHNDIAGETLLQRIDGPSAQAFADQVVGELRRRAAARANQARASRASSIGAGQAGSEK